MYRAIGKRIESGAQSDGKVPVTVAGCSLRCQISRILFGYIVFGNSGHHIGANGRQRIDIITLGNLLDRRADELLGCSLRLSGLPAPAGAELPPLCALPDGWRYLGDCESS
jgi:hypothetical protein